MTQGPLVAATPSHDPDKAEIRGGGSPPYVGLEPPTRPGLTDPNDRDDARQLVTVLLAAIQRERGRADQFYIRSRNLLAFASALFVAAQAAFLANMGREVADARLVSSGEAGTIAWCALTGLVFLVTTAILIFGWADRARAVDLTSGEDLLENWMTPSADEARFALLETLVVKLANEEKSWRGANKTRARLTIAAAGLAGLATLATLVELVVLYFAVR